MVLLYWTLGKSAGRRWSGWVCKEMKRLYIPNTPQRLLVDGEATNESRFLMHCVFVDDGVDSKVGRRVASSTHAL